MSGEKREKGPATIGRGRPPDIEGLNTKIYIRKYTFCDKMHDPITCREKPPN